MSRRLASRRLVSRRLAWFVLLASTVHCGVSQGQVKMPDRGICAHRGASETHPENTLVAFRESLRLGAHMIEFDVALSKDNQLVLMHDATIDRTTNGKGPIGDWILADLQQLDAGSWKNSRFKNERIPTLDETLAMMPENIWLNVHLKGGAELAEKVARRIVAAGREHQAFLACGADAAEAAKQVDSRILVCNMERQANSQQYVQETIEMNADFIQLYGGDSVDASFAPQLRAQEVRINYCCSDDGEKVKAMFKAGVEFPLVDRLGAMLEVADGLKIPRLQPTYRSRVTLNKDSPSNLVRPPSRLIEQRRLKKGTASQGLALSEGGHYSSTARLIYRYDKEWNYLGEKEIQVEGVNHVGAIDYHDGFLWAGLLHGPEGGKHDPKLNRSIIAKIRASDLEVVQTWDITAEVNWIDPVCFDGKFIWVGDLSDLGIHRYRIDGEKLVRDGVFRYPAGMHFSQGVRVVGKKLYSIHTFGDLDGLFEFDVPDDLTNEPQLPTRVWHIAENGMHLEGFDFVPGTTHQIWHAQGGQVDHYELSIKP